MSLQELYQKKGQIEFEITNEILELEESRDIAREKMAIEDIREAIKQNALKEDLKESVEASEKEEEDIAKGAIDVNGSLKKAIDKAGPGSTLEVTPDDWDTMLSLKNPRGITLIAKGDVYMKGLRLLDPVDFRLEGFKSKGVSQIIKITGKNGKNFRLSGSKFEDFSKAVFVDYSQGGRCDGIYDFNNTFLNFSKSAYDISPGSKNFISRSIYADAKFNDSENFCMPVILRDEVTGKIEMSNGVLMNVLYAWYQRDNKTTYFNGDCLTIENKCSTANLKGMLFSKATDGGIDSKSPIIFSDENVIQFCKRGLRLWGRGQAKASRVEKNGLMIKGCTPEFCEPWLKNAAANTKRPDHWKPKYGYASVWKRWNDGVIDGYENINFVDTPSTVSIN